MTDTEYLAYGKWTVNGITPSWIVSLDRDAPNRKLTFHCAAAYDNLNADPRTEIRIYENMVCTIVHNDLLLNGGSKLQVAGGDVVTLIEKDTPFGDISYTAALEALVYTEDDMSDDMILFDLVFDYEISGAGAAFVYTPSYYGYSNITQYYEWYYLVNGVWTKANTDSSSGAYGTEIGFMQIVETKQVKKVEVYGSACRLPGAITIDGSIEGTQDWNYYHDPDPGSNQPPNQPFQKLTFNFAPGSYPTVLTLHTTEHHGDDPNHGCWLKWIKVTYV